MTLHVLGSESKGNCYLMVADNGEVLIIEAGLPFWDVKQALHFDITGIVGCIVSHAHGDHSKYLKDYAKAGINVYANADTIDLRKPGHRGITINDKQMLRLCGYFIKPVTVPHGGVPCFAYLINHIDSGKILFVTDAQSMPYAFKDLSHVLIEANYSDEADATGHGIGSHMALDTAKEFIRGVSSPALRNAVLLHLSASNSDEKQFIKEIKEVAPFATVTVADKGVKVNLNIKPF